MPARRAAHSQSNPPGLQPRSLDRPRRRRLLHRDVDLRVVSRRADPSFTRSGPLATADASAATPESAQHARRSRLVRDLGAVSDPRRRPVSPGLHRREAVRADVAAGRRAAHRCATSTTTSSPAPRSRATGPIRSPSTAAASIRRSSTTTTAGSICVNMLWDHRPGQNRFAGIVLQEYSPGERRADRRTSADLHRDPLGFTEAPHLYKRNGYYYLIVAEGGTGWGHAVTMARPRTLTGPVRASSRRPHPDRPRPSGCRAAARRACRSRRDAERRDLHGLSLRATAAESRPLHARSRNGDSADGVVGRRLASHR